MKLFPVWGKVQNLHSVFIVTNLCWEHLHFFLEEEDLFNAFWTSHALNSANFRVTKKSRLLTQPVQSWSISTFDRCIEMRWKSMTCGLEVLPAIPFSVMKTAGDPLHLKSHSLSCLSHGSSRKAGELIFRKSLCVFLLSLASVPSRGTDEKMFLSILQPPIIPDHSGMEFSTLSPPLSPALISFIS